MSNSHTDPVSLNSPDLIFAIAVPSPLRCLFDYRAPATGPLPQPGMRVQVPFGSRRRIGMVIRHQHGSAIKPAKLKRIHACLDTNPVLDAGLLKLMEFASSYFHHPPGEVMACMLPPALRRGGLLQPRTRKCWQLTLAGRQVELKSLLRAPRQCDVLQQLRGAAGPLSRDQLQADTGVLRRLYKNALIETVDVIQEPNDAPAWADLESLAQAPVVNPGPSLNDQQQQAVTAISGSFGRFQGFLLDGVTGSGKTEVYLDLIRQLQCQGRQTLVLVPEIGLTPQLLARFKDRLGIAITTIHSGLTERQRLESWRWAQTGRSSVVIGTRSAVFVPLPRLGLIIVDEEHDLSFKQQDGLRYCARDLAVVRASQARVPIVLGSATPSLESFNNAKRNNYQRLVLAHRAGKSTQPHVDVIDLRGRTLQAGLSQPLEHAIESCLDQGEQALLFINRRGFAPVLLCHACGTPCDCPRCDAHLVLHQADGCLHCHHCQRVQTPPHTCACGAQNSFVAVGAGTQRVMERLQQRFPGARIARVDKDSTRRTGSMEAMLAAVHGGEIDLLVGTQMLAKGHHFPNVTLVGIIDVDGGLFSADFRSAERMAQLFVQVSGRAGRGVRPGQVLLQTHYPDHPLLRLLITGGYRGFAESALCEREKMGLPPFSFQALLRAEAHEAGLARAYLQSVRDACPAPQQVAVYGPVAAPLERRAGWVRAQLLLEATDRASLHGCIRDWLPKLQGLKLARRVRWSLDIDPLDMM